MSNLIHEITTFAHDDTNDWIHDDANDWILFQQCCESATPNHTADQLKREPEQVLVNEDDHQVDKYEDDHQVNNYEDDHQFDNYEDNISYCYLHDDNGDDQVQLWGVT